MPNRPSVTLELDPERVTVLQFDEPYLNTQPDVVYVVRYGRDGRPDTIYVYVPQGDLKIEAVRP